MYGSARSLVAMVSPEHLSDSDLYNRSSVKVETNAVREFVPGISIIFHPKSSKNSMKN